MKYTVVCSLILFSLACTDTQPPRETEVLPAFYKEGHRGARGLMPENTIPSMIKAIELGVNVIEVDVYITKDSQVLIAHDPYANIKYTLHADGSEIAKEQAKEYVWHQMNYEDIRKFDVGSKYYDAFPQQAKLKTYMPLLGELIDSVEAYTSTHNLQGIMYNIELKTSEKHDSLEYNAGPEEMVQRVMKVVKSKDIGDRFYIQSFDVRPLQVIHEQYPGVVIGFLTGDPSASVEDNLKKLGFIPDIYSPHYGLVTQDMATFCKSKNMKLVPWTVNNEEDISKMIGVGVDGIITDYPDLLK